MSEVPLEEGRAPQRMASPDGLASGQTGPSLLSESSSSQKKEGQEVTSLERRHAQTAPHLRMEVT